MRRLLPDDIEGALPPGPEIENTAKSLSNVATRWTPSRCMTAKLVRSAMEKS